MNLFVYGSLKSTLLLKELLDRVPESIPAILQGYKKIPKAYECRYPVAIKHTKSILTGKLLLNLTKEDFKKIDKYEATPENFYKKSKVPVKTKKGKFPAAVYIRNRV